MTPALRDYIESWLEKADNDLATAQRLLDIKPMILDNACFHCQQAIEKYLKAYLNYNGKETERTHNIIFLLSQAADFDAVFATIDAMNINAYAVQARYPDFTIIPDEDEAKAYYQLALHIKSQVAERIVF